MKYAAMFLPLFALGLGVASQAAEHIVLDEENWEAVVPVGKEVDCIYGDHVLRSNRLIAVVANPVDTRNANLTNSDEKIALADGIRADGEFGFGTNKDQNLWWCQDRYWEQTYGVIADSLVACTVPSKGGRCQSQ